MYKIKYSVIQERSVSVVSLLVFVVNKHHLLFILVYLMHIHNALSLP